MQLIKFFTKNYQFKKIIIAHHNIEKAGKFFHNNKCTIIGGELIWQTQIQTEKLFQLLLKL